MEVGAHEVLQEVILLPLVESFVEGGLELEVIGVGEFGLGDGVDFGDFLEGELVAESQLGPRGLAVGVEVFLAEVLQPDAEAGGVVVKDGGNADAEFGEALGGGGELGIVRAGHGIDHKDHGLLSGAGPGEAIKMPIRAAFDDGFKLAWQTSEFGEGLAGENEKGFVFGRHGGPVGAGKGKGDGLAEGLQSNGWCGL